MTDTNVVRFPVEQCRLHGESREAFAYRQADEQFWRGYSCVRAFRDDLAAHIFADLEIRRADE